MNADVSQARDQPAQPWFRRSKEGEPFKLSSLVTTGNQAYHCLACFPWTAQTLHSVWDGRALRDDESRRCWDEIVQRWTGTIAVGGTGRLYIFPKLATVRPIQVTLPEGNAEVRSIAWAISPREPFRPLLVFTITSVILIFDVISHSIVGRLRGHGGPITSLVVHSSQPQLFCTTSRDFTARLYDLAFTPVQVPNNPIWPPNTTPSLAGPAHGLHMCDPEGEGIGRCVSVMVGGRSGGHRGAALSSAFHPSAPLIATGGMDRAVKIWRIPPAVFSTPAEIENEAPPSLAREDKPLFSTDLIHKARVFQIEWLADDTLISCSAPAVMRHDQEDREDTHDEEGTVVVWQWLGFNRFFPPGKVPQKIMRGTASDWRNSESFKILSAYHLPLVTKHVHVYRSLYHDPMVLIPIGKVIRLFNIADFRPRKPPKFPVDDIVSLTAKMRLDDDGGREGTAAQGQPIHADMEVTGSTSGGGKERNQQQADEGAGEGANQGQTPCRSNTVYPPPAPLDMLFDSVEGWEVVAQLQRHDSPPDMPDIAACAMGFDGQRIVAVGVNCNLYIWRPREGLHVA